MQWGSHNIYNNLLCQLHHTVAAYCLIVDKKVSLKQYNYPICTAFYTVYYTLDSDWGANRVFICLNFRFLSFFFLLLLLSFLLLSVFLPFFLFFPFLSFFPFFFFLRPDLSFNLLPKTAPNSGRDLSLFQKQIQIKTMLSTHAPTCSSYIVVCTEGRHSSIMDVTWVLIVYWTYQTNSLRQYRQRVK